MAITPTNQQQQVQRIPHSKYIDKVRWLHSASSPLTKTIIFASFDTYTNTPSLETLSLPQQQQNPNFKTLSSWTPPARISALKTSPSSPLVAAATFYGSLHLLPATGAGEFLGPPTTEVEGKEFHVGPIGCVDLRECECVCVGHDGRVNLVRVDGGGERGSGFRRVFDGDGLVSYCAVKWASPSEFITSGVGGGVGLQWWDLRRNGGSPVAQLKGDWGNGTSPGIIHSVDIHSSRKHTCLAGGSSGTVFAWDLRWQQQPIILSGVGASESMRNTLSESEVWEVQYDYHTKTSNNNISSSRILPAMICSEDGILGVVEQGEEPIELLAEPCAINSFDIDSQNPSDVVCSLEWESIVLLSRQ